MKNCSKCQTVKPFEAFYASSTHKSGYASWCKGCEAERSKAKNAINREQRLAKAKEWRDANKDKQIKAVKTWRESNPERTAAMYRDWADRNRDKVNAKWMKRDASKKCRTPAWLSTDDYWMIEQAYDIAAKRTHTLGIPHHVDHIVPLQGKTVSGLHVPWNLQVIPAKENRMKSNQLITNLTERLVALEGK
jgi:hypothetical protein